MRCQILVSFLISRVLGNEMEVFATDDQSSVHFRGYDGAGKDTPTDRDQASKGAFLVLRASSAPGSSWEDTSI